jgi:hypothetical protein
MAARNLKKQFAHFYPDIVAIFGKATGAGAANLTALTGPGIASVAYNAATGKLKVTLEDKWAALLYADATIIDPTGVDDWEFVVESELVATSKTIDIAVFKGGALADLTTDEKIMLHIVVTNSARTR